MGIFGFDAEMQLPAVRFRLDRQQGHVFIQALLDRGEQAIPGKVERCGRGIDGFNARRLDRCRIGRPGLRCHVLRIGKQTGLLQLCRGTRDPVLVQPDAQGGRCKRQREQDRGTGWRGSALKVDMH